MQILLLEKVSTQILGSKHALQHSIHVTGVSKISQSHNTRTELVRLVLEKMKSSFSEKEFTSFVNYRYKASTFKWKVLYFVFKNLNRTGLSKSGLMYAMSLWPGTTALNFAVMRGDVEIVKILLENGADPYVENDLGMNAFEICDEAGPFPSVRKVLEEHDGRD